MAVSCKNSYDADIGIGITGTTGNVDLKNKDSVPGQVYYAIAFSDTIEDGFLKWESRNPVWHTNYMRRGRLEIGCERYSSVHRIDKCSGQRPDNTVSTAFSVSGWMPEIASLMYIT